jgi:hypothetical protein
MKVGDAIKLKKAKAWGKDLGELVGIIVEFVPTTPTEVTGEDFVRCLWPTGRIDQVWRKGSELEVVNESR